MEVDGDIWPSYYAFILYTSFEEHLAYVRCVQFIKYGVVYSTKSPKLMLNLSLIYLRNILL